MAGNIDKREHHRFMAMLEIRLLSPQGLPSDLRLVTLDVSLGGMRCASNHALSVGARLSLALKLVGGGLVDPFEIELNAEVLRSVEKPSPDPNRLHAIALQFVQLDSTLRRRLQDYLNAL